MLEGQVLERINGHDSQLGLGDYGIIQVGVPHALRNVGDDSVRWLEMLSPQPKAPGQESKEKRPWLKASRPICGIRGRANLVTLTTRSYRRPARCKWRATGAAAEVASP
jgi:hypothetical protein